MRKLSAIARIISFISPECMIVTDPTEVIGIQFDHYR